MSLEIRRAIYFNFCVGARFRITPVPTSQEEVTFIYDSLQKIAPVDYFSMLPARHTSTNLFGFTASVLFNVTGQESQLDPLSGLDPSVDVKLDAQQQRRREMRNYLSSICGIPRHSYIKDDEKYWEGKVQVPFKHRLRSFGRKFDGKYRLTSSTIDLPFFTMETKVKRGELDDALQFNFQKYHQMEPLFVWTGLGAALVIRHESLPSVRITTKDLGNMDLTDLHKKPPAHTVHWKPKNFLGFVDKY